ncbi:ATP-grasp domain-containing protein [Streptomyces sp. BI20]|uniref:ATP-grasp domain-containing protein n=1 Tax=Streptomyces sp. BI20 TaxID=3403460 RepID=UPI003C730F0A
MAVLLSPRPAELAAAHRVGAAAVAVTPAHPAPTAREGADRRVRVDWRDHTALVRALRELPEVRARRAAVLGLDGPAEALAAARANAALGLPAGAGPGPGTVSVLADKAATRALSNTLHPTRPVSFVRCGRADLLPFLTGLIGTPCVVRPRCGSRGEGVRLVTGPAQAEAAARVYPAVTDLIVEEWLPGPELTVVTLSHAGRHRILGHTLRRPGPADGPLALAAGHELTAPLPPETAAAVRALVEGVLNLAGHREGAAHLDLVLTPYGPRLIEAHAHPPAEELCGLLRLGRGVDVPGLVIAAALGLPAPLATPRTTAPAGLRYVDLPPGTHAPRALRAAVAAARAVPGVVRVRLPDTDPGRPLTVHHPATGSRRHGWILATAPDRRALRACLGEAARRLALLLAPPPTRRLPCP